MRDLKLSPPLLHAAGLLGCLLIVATSYGVGIRPLKHEAALLQQRRSSARQFAGTRSVVLARTAKLSAEERQLRRAVAALNRRFADNRREDELLKTISLASRKSGAQLLDFQPGGRGSFDQVPTFAVRISLRGAFAAVVRFLAELQKSPRMLRVTQWQIQPTDRSSDRFDVRVEVQQFHRPSRKQTAPAKGARP